MTIPRQCISPNCELPLYAPVTYCPFCGRRQQHDSSATVVNSTSEVDASHERIAASATDATVLIPLVDEDTAKATQITEPVVTTAKPRGAKLWWIAGIAVLTALFAALQFDRFLGGSQCEAPSRNVLIVLDFSGQPSLATSEIINRIQILFDKTVSSDRFAIFDTRADRPIFEACGAPLSFTKRAQTRQQLTEIVSHAVTDSAFSPSKSPPDFTKAHRQKISQKITDLSLTNYLRANENSLHLVSDLVEGNAALFEKLCFPQERATENFRAERRGGMEQPAFANTHVYLHLVPRQDINAQSLNCRDKYWRWLLANASGSGSGLSIEYLPSSIRSSSNE